MFDEEEEWKIKCSHYFVACAVKSNNQNNNNNNNNTGSGSGWIWGYEKNEYCEKPEAKDDDADRKAIALVDNETGMFFIPD